MPVAVVIGGDPAVHLAAAAPMPSAVDPLGLAGLLREKPLDAVACRSIDLLVPAESDIVIEGHIDPADAETRTAPRFSPTDRIIADQPGHTIHVTAMTHRANRIFPAAVPGMDCNEVCLRDRVMARVFLPLVEDANSRVGRFRSALVRRRQAPGDRRHSQDLCGPGTAGRDGMPGGCGRFVLPGCW